MRKVKRVGITFGIIIFAVVSVLLIFRSVNQLIIKNDGEEIVKNGGISELVELEVNDTKQFLLIEGTDKTKPILLVLHGGPGVPFPFGVGARGAFPQLTENFVTVYYDQRGSGKSYSKDIPMETMNIGQFVEDTNIIVEYLKKRFETEKVMIMGTSWGSILGVKYSMKYPENVAAYIGMSQFVNHKENQLRAMDWLVRIAKENHDNKLLAELLSLGEPLFTGVKEEQLMTYIKKYGGENYSDEKVEKANILEMLKPALVSPDYSLGDIYKAIISGATFSLVDAVDLQTELNEVNFISEAVELKVPVYIFQGVQDKITNYALAKEFTEKLSTPAGKEFITLEQSAHYPNSTDFKLVFDKLEKIASDL